MWVPVDRCMWEDGPGIIYKAPEMFWSGRHCTNPVAVAVCDTSPSVKIQSFFTLCEEHCILYIRQLTDTGTDEFREAWVEGLENYYKREEEDKEKERLALFQ